MFPPRRAKNGMAAIVKGTQAAVVPIDVPTTIRVKGMIATIKIMKGTERVRILRWRPTPLLRAAFSKMLTFRTLPPKRLPRGIPK